MNKIQIKKLKLENFKLFDSKTFFFENNDLIVLDGPNGFGKTSLFDAIELLITKSITRINRAAGTVIKSFSYNDPLLLCKDAIEISGTGEVFISVTMEVAKGDEIFVLCRRMKCISRTNGKAYPDNFAEFNLYLLPQFDSEVGDGNLLTGAEENELIIRLFGSNIHTYYSLFYYIEQEDSTHFLKRNERERKDFISSLFDTNEQEVQRKKIDIIKRRLSVKLKEVSTSITSLQVKKEEIKKRLQDENVEVVPFKPVLSKLGVLKAWDLEHSILEEQVYDAGKNELQAIEDFLKNFAAFKQDRINARMISYAEDQNLLRSTIVLLHFLPDIADITTTYNAQLEILQTIEKLTPKKIGDTLLKNLVDFDRISLLLQIDPPLRSLVTGIEQLRKLSTNANELDLIIRELNNSRKDLNAKFLKVKENEGVNENECPLCGFDWSTFEQLMNAIQEKETRFTNLYKGNIEQIDTLLEQIMENELKQLFQAFKSYEVNSIIIQDAFYMQLLEALKHKNEVTAFATWLSKYDLDVTPFLRKEFNNVQPVLNEETQALVRFLIEKQKPVNKEIIQKNFLRVYNDFFESSEDKLNMISLSDLKKKKEYLDYIWYQTSNASLKNIDESLSQSLAYSAKLKVLDENLKQLSGDYLLELNLFRSRVIKDIEIPFYLYSARIIQNYQRGLGLFIHGDDGQELKTIKFLSDLNSNHDALFSLSSGQLTALVIAFSLALNKIYAENSILLIDDPTQTMDEINVTSLIELLRNEFGDKQIFLSTHEDHTSMYLRYKFQKYGKETKRINLKETAFLE